MTINVTLSNLANLQNEATAVSTINANSSTIIASFLEALNTSGDQMLGNLDMNGWQILNLPAPSSNYSPLRLIDFQSLNGGGSITVSPLPSGGLIGQLLAKTSNSNFAVAWTNTLQGSGASYPNYFPLILSSTTTNNFLQMTVPSTRSWNWTYVSQNIGSGSNEPTLQLQSDLPGYPSLAFAQGGRVLINNPVIGFPNLNNSMNDATGPALAIGGDILAGDLGYFGSTAHSVITGAISNGGIIQINISSDPTGSLANGKIVQIGGVGGVPNATGIWTISNYVTNTSFTLVGSTFAGAYTSGGWFGTGQDVQNVGRRYPGYIPSPTTLTTSFNLTDGSSGLNASQVAGAFIITYPDSSLLGITGFDGNPSPGSIALVTYSGVTPSTPSYISLLGRTANGVVSEWMRILQGQISFDTLAASAIPANGLSYFNSEMVLSGSTGASLASGSNVLLTANSSSQVAITIPGVQSTLLIGADSAAPTYNQISLNGVLGNGGLGILGGASGDNTLYLDVPNGGDLNFTINGTSQGIWNGTGLGLGGSPSFPLQVQQTQTATSGILYAAQINVTVTPTATSSAAYRGLRTTVINTSTSPLNSEIRGYQMLAEHSSTSSVNVVMAMDAEVINNTSGIIGQATAYNTKIQNNSGGTITTANNITINTPSGAATTGITSTWVSVNGIEIQDQNPSGSGTNTLTNPPTALLIDSQTGAGAFAIKQIGSGINSFASNIICGSSIKSSSPTAGIGYTTGAGTSVTQGTNRTTGVTSNAITGSITLFSTAGSPSASSFTVTNTSVAATDTIVTSQKSGTNLYNTFVSNVTSGAFNITFFTTGGTASDAPVINYTVIKGSAN